MKEKRIPCNTQINLLGKKKRKKERKGGGNKTKKPLSGEYVSLGS